VGTSYLLRGRKSTDRRLNVQLEREIPNVEKGISSFKITQLVKDERGERCTLRKRNHE